MPQEICPVCRKKGYKVVMRRRHRSYVYFKHFERIDGKLIQRNCYVGPADRYDDKTVRTVERAVKQLDVEKIYTLLSDEQRRKLAQLLC